MNRKALVVSVLALVSTFGMGALSVRSQTRANPTPQVSGAAVGVPGSKIALINTEAFLDEKQGITRLVSAVGDIEREFGARRTELQQMQTRIKAIADDLAKTQNVADPAALRNKQQQGEALQREYKFKADDAQAAYQKRVQERTTPINEDIGKALDAFAKQRGITLMLDASKLAQIGAILTASDSMDVTKAFITEYNSRGSAGGPK